MQGKRVEAVRYEGGGFQSLQPGEYTNIDGCWHGCTPNDEGCNLSAHAVTEHEDGTITVSPSILVSMRVDGKDVELWHGYLERGIWRSC